MAHPRARLRTQRRTMARDLVQRYNAQRTEGPKLKLRDVWQLFITLHDGRGFYTPKTKNPLQ